MTRATARCVTRTSMFRQRTRRPRASAWGVAPRARSKSRKAEAFVLFAVGATGFPEFRAPSYGRRQGSSYAIRPALPGKATTTEIHHFAKAVRVCGPDVVNVIGGHNV